MKPNVTIPFNIICDESTETIWDHRYISNIPDFEIKQIIQYKQEQIVQGLDDDLNDKFSPEHIVVQSILIAHIKAWGTLKERERLMVLKLNTVETCINDVEQLLKLKKIHHFWKINPGCDDEIDFNKTLTTILIILKKSLNKS